MASLASSLGAGLGPLVGGIFADYFSERTLRVTFEWIDPVRMFAFPAVDLTSFGFLFGIAFAIGVIILNTLTTIREEGEADRKAVMDALLAPTHEMTRTLGSVPASRFIREFPYTYLRRVPGLDVALGVTAYQAAATVRTAVASASRGEHTAAEIARRVRTAVLGVMRQSQGQGDIGHVLTFYAAKGAMNCMNELTPDVGQLARGAVLGTLTGVENTSVNIHEAVRSASQGAIVGADEAGADLSIVATNVVEGARLAAHDLDISEEEAMDQAAWGAIAAATAIGPAAISRVSAALGETPVRTDLQP